MPFKRRNAGRSKHGRGHVNSVRCSNCGRSVPKDKAIKRFNVRNIVDASAQRDIREACAYSQQGVARKHIKPSSCFRNILYTLYINLPTSVSDLVFPGCEVGRTLVRDGYRNISGGYDLVSLSSVYSKHFSSVVINNVNVICLRIIKSLNFDFDEICSLFNWFKFWTSRICNSDSKCKCTCKCVTECTGNFICLCECNKGDASNGFCMCICKKDDNCKCVCICICNKTGNQCCCESKKHECKECLVKINLSILQSQSCIILNCLRWIKCCLYKQGTINYASIISRIHLIELLFKDIGTKIHQLIKLKNILSSYYTITKSCKPCESCGCKDKIKDLIDIISVSCRYHYRINYELKGLRSFVYYKMFYPKYNEIIEKLNNSVLPLLKNISQKNNCISNSTTNNTSLAQVNNAIMNLMSMMVINESMFVVSRLYIYYNIKSEIDNMFQILEYCNCIRAFDITNTKKTWNEQMISEILDHIQNKPRYVCLCLLVRYVLLYGLYKVNNKYNKIYMDMLGCMSRSFKKYSYSMNHVFHVYKLIMLIIAFDKIISWMRKKFIGYKECFCYNVNNSYHPYLISTILFVSSLIENIWSMDSETMRLSIEKISSLISEFEKVDSESNKSTDNTFNSTLNDIKRCLFCPLKFCTLRTKLPFIFKFIKSSQKVKVLEFIIKPYISKISLYDIFHFEKFINELKQYDTMTDSIGRNFRHLLDSYKKIDCSNNLCTKFKNECCVLSSSIIIIMSMLISFIIRSKLYSKRCGEMKKRLCDFLELVCKCNSSECCIKQLLGSSNDVCTQINGSNGCDDLLKNCVESCCVKECCKGGCPCKHLKDSWDNFKKLCCYIGKNWLLMLGYPSLLIPLKVVTWCS